MQNLFDTDGMVIVISILLLIWIAITIYIFVIDNKLERIEKIMKAKNETE